MFVLSPSSLHDLTYSCGSARACLDTFYFSFSAPFLALLIYVNIFSHNPNPNEPNSVCFLLVSKNASRLPKVLRSRAAPILGRTRVIVRQFGTHRLTLETLTLNLQHRCLANFFSFFFWCQEDRVRVASARQKM